MLSNIIFRAQPLDNISDNHIEIDDVLVVPGDVAKTNYASEKISNINKEKNIILKERDIEIIKIGQKMLITVPTEQKDSFGRNAPFLCYFEFLPGIDSNLISQEVVQKIQKFTNHIGRSLGTDTPIILQNKIKEALKHPDPLGRNFLNNTGCIVVGAAVLTVSVAVSALALHHITTK